MDRPGAYNLQLYRGDTYGWTFVLWNDESKTVPLDLTGVIANAHIASSAGSPAIATLVCTILANQITVTFPVDLWDQLTVKRGVWDLELTYPSGDVFTVVAGSVSVTTDVTKVEQ